MLSINKAYKKAVLLVANSEWHSQAVGQMTSNTAFDTISIKDMVNIVNNRTYS